MWKSFTCVLKRACAEATSKMLNPQALSQILSVLGHDLINSLRQVISETDSIPESRLMCCSRWKQDARGQQPWHTVAVPGEVLITPPPVPSSLPF